MRPLEGDHAAGELQEGEVALVLLRPADEDTAVAVEPGVTCLDHPAARSPVEDARNRALKNALKLLAKRKHLVQAIDQQIRDSGIEVSPVAIPDDLDRIRHR
jgi:hypothetical protein